MDNWTSGYVAEIDYTYGYCPELNPQRTRFALASKGLASPTIETACELGFGQGISTNIHAAAGMVDWWGTDFNPSQAAFAREMAGASGSSANLYDEAFSDFVNREDLPDFDYICLHGIWSWISDQNRTLISDFVRRKLKVGGVLLISYNTLPGWANFAPIRHLMAEHVEVLGSKGSGIAKNIGAAIEFANNLLEANPRFATDSPEIQERLNILKNQNPRYLAHEYFNKDWQPMYFSDVARWFDNAKIEFAGSADYFEMIDVINFSGAQQTLLAEIADQRFRETIKDFLANQQFRRDYWIKGPLQLNQLEKTEALKSQSVVLVEQRAEISLTAKAKIGEAKLHPAIYEPILGFLQDHKPHSIEEITSVVAGSKISFAQVVEAITMLSGKNSISFVQDDHESAEIHNRVKALNEWIINKSRRMNQINFLASPVTGGGIGIGRFNQLFLLQQQLGVNTPAELAANVWKILEAQGEKIITDGAPMMSTEDNVAALTKQATEFKEKTLPMLRILGIS